MTLLPSALIISVVFLAVVHAALNSTKPQQNSATSKTLRIPIRQKKVHGSNGFHKHVKRGLFKDDIYNDFGSIYMIDVSIGTPPQTFRLAVDTGSADLWVPGSDCPPNSCPCTKFDESKSKTYQSSTDSFAIQYGIGSVNGSYATDTITIAGATVLGQKFGLASVTADIMEQPDMIDVSNNTSINGTSPVIMNGIFGLGYPRLTRAYSQSGNAYNPFVFNLVAQNLIENPVFSIFLNSISEADWSGEILFGGYDQNKFIGNLTYLDVAGLTAKITSEDSTTRMSNGYYYWMVYAQGIGVKNPLTTNGKPMTWGMSELGAFILDTGTTLTYFPELITTQIVTAFVGAGKFTLDPQYNVYIIDCAAATNSSFQFELILSKTAQVGNEQPIIVSVPAKELVISMEGNSVENSHNCMFGIAPLGKSSSLRSSNMYLIGDSVLRSLYMVYDMGKNRVGLAANKNMGGTVVVGSQTSANPPASDAISKSGTNSNSSSSATVFWIGIRTFLLLFWTIYFFIN